MPSRFYRIEQIIFRTPEGRFQMTFVPPTPNPRAFVNALLDEYLADGPSDIDGAWLQETLVEHGILVPFEATEPCSPAGCICAEVGDFPMTCYRIAPGVRDVAS